jgi:hypothetical protein
MALNRLMLESVLLLPCGLCAREQNAILQIFSFLSALAAGIIAIIFTYYTTERTFNTNQVTMCTALL